MGNEGVQKIIGLLIVVIFIGAVAGAMLTAINPIADGGSLNQTGWTTTQIALWTVVGIFVIIAIVYAIGKQADLI